MGSENLTDLGVSPPHEYTEPFGIVLYVPSREVSPLCASNDAKKESLGPAAPGSKKKARTHTHTHPEVYDYCR